jgi:hypothetical protein
LAVFWRSSAVESLFGAISAAFLMQSVDTGSRLRQQLSMTATACAIMIVAPLASALHGRRAAEAILLIVWAGAVFYARRFLKGNGGFTLFAFTEVLLATALPGNPKAQFLTAAVGFAIAFVLRFWIWPADEVRAFQDAVDAFCRSATQIAVGGGETAGLLDRLRAAAFFTHNLLTEHPELSESGKRDRIVRLEYEALQSLRMLHEARRRRPGESDPACARIHTSIRDLASCRLEQIRREFHA